jgi:ubiquitin-protein ligase
MVTKIFHPNVSKQGEICVDTLKKGWTPETGIRFGLSCASALHEPQSQPG